MPNLIEAIMSVILLLSIVTAILMNLIERKRSGPPSNEKVLTSKAQALILQGSNGVFALFYLILAPFLLLFDYFDQILGWSTVTPLIMLPNIIQLLQISGMVLFLVGMAMVVAGHLTLKEQFADLWAPSKLGSKFVRTGIYSRIRHPIYTGTMLFEIGLVIFFQTWFGLLLLIPSFVIIVNTAHKEETFLVKVFGREYEEYMSKTRRFLPKLKR